MPTPDYSKFAGSKLTAPPPDVFTRFIGSRGGGAEANQQARSNLVVKDSITNLEGQRKLYSQSVDLPSVAANTTSNTDITTASQTCEQGDYIKFIGGEIDHGCIIVGCLPCPSNDTIRLRVANVTAGAIDPTATTLYFVIHKFVSAQ